MMQRLRELLASGLVAIAVLIVLWWLLRSVLGMFLWLVNATVFIAVIVLLFAAARRLRKPKNPKF